VLDNLSSGKLGNLRAWLDRIEFLEGDIRDLDAVREAMNGVDYVLHHAALASVVGSLADPQAYHEVNATGTLNVLIAARDAGVQRVVYAGSSAAYGNNSALPLWEDLGTDPLSPYAASKLAGEQYARAFAESYGLETVCLRYFNAFGPRQDPNAEYAAVIPKFITLMLAGRAPTIYGDGRQTRDFVYVGNIADANLLACRAEGVSGETFNIASGQSIDLLQLAALIAEITGRQLEPVLAPARAGEVRHSAAAIAKAETRLGYRPAISLAEGLRSTVTSLEPLSLPGPIRQLELVR
jgi:UDP-glucose 4-epimerase